MVREVEGRLGKTGYKGRKIVQEGVAKSIISSRIVT
jgi:hypothetical protein